MRHAYVMSWQSPTSSRRRWKFIARSSGTCRPLQTWPQVVLENADGIKNTATLYRSNLATVWFRLVPPFLHAKNVYSTNQPWFSASQWIHEIVAYFLPIDLISQSIISCFVSFLLSIILKLKSNEIEKVKCKILILTRYFLKITC